MREKLLARLQSQNEKVEEAAPEGEPTENLEPVVEEGDLL
jgi:hypothetical protein